MSFTAKYPGTCVVCGGGIRPGQLCRYGSEGPEHVTCPEPRPMCPECFTEKSANGSCLCE